MSENWYSTGPAVLPQGTVEILKPAMPPQPPFGFSFREWMTARRDLAKKKSLARTMVKRLAKNGINPEMGYRSVEAADVYEMMTPILHECQLGFEVEQVNERVEMAKSGAPINKVDLQITYMDLETGYFEQKTITGAGLDWQDKGIYKAFTGATKYALILEFLIPTGGDDPMPGPSDPETASTKPEAPKTSDPEPAPQAPKTASTGRRGTGTNKDKAEGEKPPQTSGEAGQVGPITSDQVGQIKLKVGQLNDFPGQPVEKRNNGIMAVYMSLAAKLKMSNLDATLLEKLNTDQAAQAILLLDEWLDKKQQIESRNAAQTGAAAE